MVFGHWDKAHLHDGPMKQQLPEGQGWNVELLDDVGGREGEAGRNDQRYSGNDLDHRNIGFSVLRRRRCRLVAWDVIVVGEGKRRFYGAAVDLALTC